MTTQAIDIPFVLPSNTDAEKSILGGILLDNGLMYESAWVLQPECFFLDAHRRVFAAMRELFDVGHPIDMLIVAEQLGKHKQLEAVGGISFLSSLTDGVPRRQSLEHLIKLVREKYMLRTLLTSIRATATDIANGDVAVADVTKSIENALLEIATTGKQAKHIGDVMREAVEEIARLRELPEGILLGRTWDFHPLNELTTGIRDDEFWLVGARPNVGKTPFGMQIALANAVSMKRHQEPGCVVVFTLEMSDLQLAFRCLIHRGYAQPWQLRDPRRMKESELTEAFEGAAHMADFPLWIDDTGNCTLRKLQNKIRFAVRRLGAKLIVIDYLQLVEGGGKNQFESASAVAKGLRSIVRETKVPIVALSQLNRNAKDPSRPPNLADLRDSGVLEQEANGVCLIHRPEIFESEDDEIGIMSNEGTFILAKVREGVKGPEPFIFDENTLTFRPGLSR